MRIPTGFMAAVRLRPRHPRTPTTAGDQVETIVSRPLYIYHLGTLALAHNSTLITYIALVLLHQNSIDSSTKPKTNLHQIDISLFAIDKYNPL